MKTAALLSVLSLACLATVGCHKDSRMEASPGMTSTKKSDCCSKDGTCTDDAKKSNMGAMGEKKASGCCSEKKTN